MSLGTLLLTALALSVDAFAVAVACGCVLVRPGVGHYLRLAGTFGGLQWAMPLLGAFLGAGLRQLLQTTAHWLAILLLAILGCKMLHDGLTSLRHKKSRPAPADPSRGLSLFLLGIATSLDALSVGFSLALIGTDVVWPAVVIGIVCALITALGLFLGQSLARLSRLQGLAECLGGLVLLGLACQIFRQAKLF